MRSEMTHTPSQALPDLVQPLPNLGRLTGRFANPTDLPNDFCSKDAVREDTGKAAEIKCVFHALRTITFLQQIFSAKFHLAISGGYKLEK